jgi:hypothetical protein
MRLQAAMRIGLTKEQIAEVLLQTVIDWLAAG